MAHNTLTRADLAAWGSGVVTPAEFHKLSTQGFQSINGDLGGVWAPSSVIEIGGTFGLLVSGPLEATGVTDLDETHLHGNLIVHTGSTFETNGDAELGSSSADLLTVNAEFVFESEGVFTDDVLFEDEVGVHAVLRVQSGGEIILNGDFSQNAGHDFEVLSDATFGGLVAFENDVEFVAGTTVTVRGDALFGTDASDEITFDGTITANEQADFWDAVIIHTGGSFSCSGPFLVQNDATIGQSGSDDFLVYSTMTIRQPLAFAFNGRVPMRPILGPDASHTFTVADANVIFVNTMTAGHTYSIDDTGAVDGDFFEIYRRVAGSHSLNIEDPIGNVIGLITVTKGDVKVMRIEGAWYAIENNN